LATGRVVRATLPDANTYALSAIGGVDSVEVRGDQVYVHAEDSDAVARYLLNETGARDLEIVARGLEDAFLSLTGRTDPASQVGQVRTADSTQTHETEGALR
jgi:ABC-2 type transport system ATP-binding protein